MNWVLKERGVPFLVGLCGSETQRTSYTVAIKTALSEHRFESISAWIGDIVARAWEMLDKEVGRAFKEMEEEERGERRRADREENAKITLTLTLTLIGGGQTGKRMQRMIA